MSCFLLCVAADSAISKGLLNGYNQNDDYIQQQDFKVITLNIQYSDIVWPRSAMAGIGATDAATGQIQQINNAENRFEWNMDPALGAAYRKIITGVTRDSTNAILPGCTVILFNTATNAVVDSQVSDSAGNYTVTDPNGVACYVVSYKAGSPDIAGTTLNTLTGV